MADGAHMSEEAQALNPPPTAFQGALESGAATAVIMAPYGRLYLQCCPFYKV